MLTCFDVADYLVSLEDQGVGDLMSNQRLQKLVYLAQGLHLAVFDAPLFLEAIEAWTYGPVVPELWRKYSVLSDRHHIGVIHCPSDIDFTKYDANAREIMGEVCIAYGQFAAWKLRQIVQDQPPYIDARASGLRGGVITHEALRAYFVTQLIV